MVLGPKDSITTKHTNMNAGSKDMSRYNVTEMQAPMYDLRVKIKQIVWNWLVICAHNDHCLMILHKVFCQYIDMVTNNEVFISTEIYKGYLSTDIRRQIATTNQLCSLGNNKYLFYSHIGINVIYMNASIQTDASGYFMVKGKI